MKSTKIDRDSPVPVYYQIELDLKKRIAQKEWAADQQIPSEMELAQQYDVSRVTLRQALAELEKDGIIKKYRGRGAFVSANPLPFVHDLDYILVSGDRVSEHGPVLTAQILELNLINDVFPEIRERLDLKEEEGAVYLKRLFYLDKKALALGRSWLPAKLVPKLERKGLLANCSLSKTLMHRYGLAPNHVEDYLEVVRPTNSERQLLQCMSDTPLLLINGLSKLESGEPLEYSNTLWLGDYVRFRLSLHRTENGFFMETK